MSDTHFDFYADKGHKFVEQLDPEDADVVVLAGDIDTARFPDQFKWVFAALVEKYRHVVMVPGNHEYYRSDWAQVWHSLNEARRGLEDRVHLLSHKDGVVVIEGQRFIGDTMWYRETAETMRGEPFFSDFHYIKNLKSWVYVENAMFDGLLCAELDSSAVVVTHHMPSEKSVHQLWKNAKSNCFFLCDQEQLIRDRQPKLWVHGHTHMAFDYMIGTTRVVCNPRGYPGERFPRGSLKYKPQLIEVP